MMAEGLAIARHSKIISLVGTMARAPPASKKVEIGVKSRRKKTKKRGKVVMSEHYVMPLNVLKADKQNQRRIKTRKE